MNRIRKTRYTLIARLQMILYAVIGYAVFQISCSLGPIAGSGTEEGNVVSGVIVDTSGNTVFEAVVTLIPFDYNPVKDQPIPDSMIDTTDNEGKYQFFISRQGVYNIEAVHISQRTRLLTEGITVAGDTTSVSAGTLRRTGALRIFLPDTVDTLDGYIYIEGSTITKELREGTYYTGNHYTVVIDSVPAGKIPPVILALKSQMVPSVIISDTATAKSDDTVNIGVDSIHKPLWRFPLIIGATASTVAHYKGFDSITVKILNQISMINKYFNDPKVFNGVLDFRVDSIYQFSTSVEEEVKKPIGEYAVRLIYDQYGLPYLSYWRSGNRVIYAPVNVGNGEDLFNEPSTRSLAWAFGMSRGCPPQYQLQVQGNKNPINGEPYSGLESIMNSPTQYLTWDTFSINIINYYQNRYSILPEIINDVFPSSMGVQTETNTGQPLQGVSVELFGVKWGSYAVCDTPVISGITNSTGIFTFQSNPFAIGNIVEYELVYSNFLIRAIQVNDTVFTWMPITEVGNAWFASPDTFYTAKMIFQ